MQLLSYASGFYSALVKCVSVNDKINSHLVSKTIVKHVILGINYIMTTFATHVKHGLCRCELEYMLARVFVLIVAQCFIRHVDGDLIYKKVRCCLGYLYAQMSQHISE